MTGTQLFFLFEILRMFMRTNYQGGVTHPMYKKDNNNISLDNDITFFTISIF